MKFDGLNGHSVIVVQSVNGYWIPHIIQQNFPLLRSDCDLQRVCGFEANAGDFLVLNSWHVTQIMHLCLLVRVPKFNATIATAYSK